MSTSNNLCGCFITWSARGQSQGSRTQALFSKIMSLRTITDCSFLIFLIWSSRAFGRQHCHQWGMWLPYSEWVSHLVSWGQPPRRVLGIRRGAEASRCCSAVMKETMGWRHTGIHRASSGARHLSSFARTQVDCFQVDMFSQWSVRDFSIPYIKWDN